MDSKDGSTWAERFWSKVDRSGGPDACHPWKTGRFPSGHGQFWLGTSSQMAHRCAFFLVHGRWPEPCGLHRCDNPPCCNVAHLFEGTATDNRTDCVAKSRHARGERQAAAKLTEQNVRDIRANYALCRVTQKELAARFGVSLPTVNQVISGRVWGHV